MKQYDLIMADPPWPERGGGGRGAQNHYDVVPYADIPRLVLSAPVFTPASAFWFGVWTTVSSLPEGLRLLDAAGCRYVTTWTWCKVDDKGQLVLGMGQYGRHGAEFIVWGKRGTIGRAPTANKSEATFDAPVGEHSAKPDKAYAMAVRTFAATTRLAMFERKHRPGFDVWGKEAPDVRSPGTATAT